MPQNDDFATVLTEVKGTLDDIRKQVHQTLDEERKANEQLLAAKADGKAFSEVQEKLERLEKAHDEAVKAYDEELKNLKISQTSQPGADRDEEVKSAFLEVLRVGNDSTLHDGQKNLLAEVLTKHFNACNDRPKTVDQVKSMLAGVDTSGGFLQVPPTIEQSILFNMSESRALYRLARKTRISGPVYKRDARITEAGASWESEVDEWPATKTPEYGQIEIGVKKLIAYPTISRDLVEDSRINMDAEVIDYSFRAFERRIGKAMVLGDSPRQPRGLLTYDTVLESKVKEDEMLWGRLGFCKTGAAAGFATTGAADCLFDLQTILKSGYHNRAGFLMNRKTGGMIRKMKNSDGDYLWQPSLIVGQPATLLGNPVYYDEYMPDVAANAFPIAFGDFSEAMVVVNRRGMTVIRDMTSVPGHIKFLIDMRLGAGVWNFEAVKLLKVAA